MPANLSQTEITKRLGLSPKSGKVYISALERGKKKNPSIETILRYLRACGASWSEFFKELDAIDFKQRHQKMIGQLSTPPAKRKIEGDAVRYEIGIEFPAKEEVKRNIDFDRLKTRIEAKVTPFLIKNKIEVRKYFDYLANLNKAGIKAVTDDYLRAGLRLNIIYGLKRIINQEIRAEIKRIEAEAHKLLCDLAVPTSWFSLYKAYVRECVKVMKKYYGKNPLALQKGLDSINQKWQEKGLKQEVLDRLEQKSSRFMLNRASKKEE